MSLSHAEPERAPEEAPRLARTPTLTEHHLLALQRTAGNAAVTRMIQRWTAPVVTLKSDEELIEDAIRDGDVTAIKEIRDYSKATSDQRLRMIELLVAQGWVGGRDESVVYTLWSSFGSGLPSVAAGNMVLWRKSVEEVSALKDHPAIKKVVADFLAAVRSTVSGYLRGNEQIVRDELARLGLDKEERVDTDKLIADQQLLLAQVADAQAQLQALRGVEVGYLDAYDPTMGPPKSPLEGGERKRPQPVPFVPGSPPQHGPNGDEEYPMVPYEMTMASHQGLTNEIGELAKGNPAVYAIMSQSGGDPEAGREVAGANPAEARAQLRDPLNTVLANIAKTGTHLADRDFLLKLGPVHRQLQGAGTFATPFAAAVIEDALADYADAQFWVELGLTSLSAAAFAIGSLASGGLAAVLLGGSLAVSGGMAATKVAEWDALRSAKGSAVSADTEVVDQGTVNTAALEAAMAVAQTVLDAAHVAVKLAKPVAGIAIDFAKKLSHGGVEGTCVGVFEAKHLGFGPDVVVKVFKTETPDQIAAFTRELENAAVAGRSRNASSFFGEVPVGVPGQRGYAMSKVEGGVTVWEGIEEHLTQAQKDAGEAEARKWAAKVKPHTGADIRAYNRHLVEQGYITYDVQGLVQEDGHWVAIDYGGVQKLPPVDSPEYATVLKNATALVDEEAARMDAIAAANATARN
jgi:hypothetical protein